MVNGHASPSESGVGTCLSSATPSPRPGDDNSTARLLRHLQGRVQQLRAQNDSLRKSSENESLNESHSSVVSTESVGTAVEFLSKRSKRRTFLHYQQIISVIFRIHPGRLF